MIVDGEGHGKLEHATGNISNTKPLTIAGKGTCDQVSVTCDYWVGQMDYVQQSPATRCAGAARRPPSLQRT